MVFRRKWVHRKRFYRVGYGHRFYGQIGDALWLGPMTKFGNRHYGYTYDSSSGAPSTINVANTSVTVAELPKPFEPYDGSETELPS